MVFQKEKSSTDEDLRKKFNIEECYVLLKPLNLKICQIRYKDQPQESSSKKCRVTNSATVPKKFKISIKSSSITENMKLEFDNIPPNQLLVKDIKAAFPEVSQKKELHFLALRYVAQRIIADAKRRNLCTVFYKNLNSQRKGPVEEEPAEMYIAVDENDLPIVEKALVSRPIVRINKMSTRKRTFSESNYTGVPKSVDGQRKKKRLKIGNKKSISVAEKKSIETEDVNTLKEGAEMGEEALKKHMNGELNEFQDGRGNLEEAQSSSDTVGILPDVCHQGELLNIQNTDVSQEMVDDQEEEMIFEIASLKKPYFKKQAFFPDLDEGSSSSSEYNPVLKVNYDLLEVGPYIDEPEDEEEEEEVPSPLMEKNDMGPYIDEPEKVEEEVPAPLMEKDDMGPYIDEPEEVEEEIPAPLMETDDMGPYIDEPEEEEEEEVPAPLMEKDDMGPYIDEPEEVEEEVPAPLMEKDDMGPYIDEPEEEEEEEEEVPAPLMETDDMSPYIDEPEEEEEVPAPLMETDDMGQYIDEPEEEEEEVLAPLMETDDMGPYIDEPEEEEEEEEEVPAPLMETDDKFENGERQEINEGLCLLIRAPADTEDREQQGNCETYDISGEYRVSSHSAISQNTSSPQCYSFFKVNCNLRPISTYIDEEEVSVILTENNDTLKNCMFPQIIDELSLQILTSRDTEVHERQANYQTYDISELYQVNNYTDINQNPSSPQFSLLKINCNLLPISMYIEVEQEVNEVPEIVPENDDTLKNCMLPQIIVEDEEVPEPLIKNNETFNDDVLQEIFEEHLGLQIPPSIQTKDHEQQEDYEACDIIEENQASNHTAINQNTDSLVTEKDSVTESKTLDDEPDLLLTDNIDEVFPDISCIETLSESIDINENLFLYGFVDNE